MNILNLVDCLQATKDGHQGHQGINQPILPEIFRVSVVLLAQWLLVPVTFVPVLINNGPMGHQNKAEGCRRHQSRGNQFHTQ
jgi:hypothetical protein